MRNETNAATPAGKIHCGLAPIGGLELRGSGRLEVSMARIMVDQETGEPLAIKCVCGVCVPLIGGDDVRCHACRRCYNTFGQGIKVEDYNNFGCGDE